MKLKKYIGAARQTLIACFFVAAATAVGFLFEEWGFGEVDIAVVYILSVLLTSRYTTGYTYSVTASILSACMYNYLFTEPFYKFSVSEPSYLAAFTVMIFTVAITGELTSKVKKNEERAREREEQSSALYQLTNYLTDAADMEGIVSIIVESVSRAFCCRAACLCFDEKGNPERNFLQQKSDEEQIHRWVDDTAEIRRRISGLRRGYDVGSEFYDWPIYGRDSILGILRIPCETARALTDSQLQLLHSMIESAALAIDRMRSAQERIKSREEAEQERYRSALLRAISHDLRTPLSGIMGAGEMLMDMTDEDDERHALAEGIYKDADWLHSMVVNILSLTRLQDGKLKLNKRLEPVEEIVGGAVMAVEKRENGREITISLPDNVLMIPMDARLIEQVLINLLDNARKHTPINREIRISVDTDESGKNAVFTVADRGTGISPIDLPYIFQMFYTTHGKSADAHRGIGLGLAICESIVKAHGGKIKAENRTDGGGALFTFTLPMEVQSNDRTN